MKEIMKIQRNNEIFLCIQNLKVNRTNFESTIILISSKNEINK